MCPLTAERRNRKSKEMFFFSTLARPFLYYACVIYSSSTPLFSVYPCFSALRRMK